MADSPQTHVVRVEHAEQGRPAAGLFARLLRAVAASAPDTPTAYFLNGAALAFEREGRSPVEVLMDCLAAGQGVPAIDNPLAFSGMGTAESVFTLHVLGATAVLTYAESGLCALAIAGPVEKARQLADLFTSQDRWYNAALTLVTFVDALSDATRSLR